MVCEVTVYDRLNDELKWIVNGGDIWEQGKGEEYVRTPVLIRLGTMVFHWHQYRSIPGFMHSALSGISYYKEVCQDPRFSLFGSTSQAGLAP